MSRFRILCAIIAALTVPMLLALPAMSDHQDGHLYDWGTGVLGLQQGLVAGTPIATCTTEFSTSTAAAISRWNSALGFTVLQTSQSCGSGIYVQTTGFSDPRTGCPSNAHACVQPASLTGDPEYSIDNPTYVFMNPSLFGPNMTWPDGDTHTSRDITHELGHVLGHADYSGCPSGNTLMDTTENCWFETPQALDIANYGAAYFADAVTNLQGSSGAPNTVSLTWTASNVHNEDYFGIFRDGSWVATAAKNAQSWTSSSQPSGQHQYSVASHTSAYCQAYGGFCGSAGPITINVQAPGTVDLEPTSYSPNPACGSPCNEGGSRSFTSYSPNPACGSPCNEGGSRSFTMWVRNNGTVTAPVTTVVMLFKGSPAPNPYGGLCNVGPIAPGAIASCTNASPVNLTFPGGNVSVKADYNNQVAESNESNNVYASGTMYVVPNAPSNARVCPGDCDLYGFKDDSDIETGFRVEL
jgi:hypothetical protein